MNNLDINNLGESAADVTKQMELGFAGRRVRRNSEAWNRRQRRAHRARWWFQQMRQVVDRAMDWQSAPAARHEQEYLALMGRRNN